MSNSIPKHEDPSSRLNAEASAEQEAESVSDHNVQPNRSKKMSRSPQLLAQCRRGATATLNGLKRLPHVVVQSLTGENPIHNRPSFWWSLGVVGIGGSAIALGWGWYALEKSIPASTEDVLTYVRDDTITIKASDGTIIQQIGPATHETLKIWEIPEQLKQAFTASEDQRFESHRGLDYQGIIRAALSNVLARDVVEGGSTITQQLARAVYFDQERTLGRKLKEMRMAQKIEQDLDKDQILERYLNLVYLGSGAYGVADASWVYFSKPVTELTLPETAMLAGLPPAPSEYSPFVNAQAAKERRNVVLQRMVKKGDITEAEAEEAMAAPMTTNPSNPKRLDRQAYYFTEYIQQELPKYVSSEVWARKGLTVETTLNLGWQTAAEEAVTDTLETYGRYQRFEQASLVAIDPRNGHIKAMVGGKDFYDQQFNRVTQAQRQPGSTFKTFVYTTALAAGFSPYRSYEDAPFIVDGYEPKNYSESFRGSLSIRDALTASINIVAVKALIDIGWDPVIDIAHKMGIESTLHPTYSLALGASEVNLLELTSAYGTLAAKGIHVKPHGIRRILDQKGKVIYEEEFNSERAIDEETAAISTWMLRNVVTSGTGGAAQIGRPVAGKTGTSDEARDLWFVGYIPQLVAGVWLGNDDNKPTWGSSSTAAATWRKFMTEVKDELRSEQFPDRPNQLEGRKGIIETKPIKPKRTIQKKIPSNTNSSRGSSGRNYANRRSNTGYSGNSNRSYSQGSRRQSRSTASQGSSTGSGTYSRRQRSSSSSQSQPAQSSYRQAPARYSAPSNSAPRQQSAPAPQPAAAPPSNPPAAAAPRVQQNLQPAPVAPPPAPPASRKAPAPAAVEHAPAAPAIAPAPVSE